MPSCRALHGERCGPTLVVMNSDRHQPLEFPGASLVWADEYYLLHLRQPMQFLSSAPLGDGLVSSAWVFSRQVDAGDELPDPINLLREHAYTLGVPPREKFVGLLTAVYHRDLQVYTVKEHGLTVTTLATVGVNHGSSPRLKQVSDYGVGGEHPAAAARRSGAINSGPVNPGTINVVALIDAKLSPGALVRASTLAAEAKSLALFEDGQTTTEGHISTGTPTDATVVGHTGRGQFFQYAGSATLVGWLVGRVTYEAVRSGLRVFKTRDYAGNP